MYEEATRLLRVRNGAREHNLPVIAKAEQLTLKEALDAVLQDFRVNGKRSINVVERRIRKHLLPYFGERRKMASITAADIRTFITRRQADVIVREARRVKLRGVWIDQPEARRPVSNAEINRELQILKRAFDLAMQDGRLGTRPHIPMLRESAPRSGFFEQEQFETVLKHLPEDLRPVVRFGYITGWRMKSEVFPLQWRQVNFERGEVTLDPGTTKNGEGRTFVMTSELRALLEEQERRRKATGQIVPWVFFRMVANGRRGPKSPRPITSFTKAWKNACKAAGCPGRILHDLRRTAVRNFRPRRRAAQRRDAHGRPQDGGHLPALPHRRRTGPARRGRAARCRRASAKAGDWKLSPIGCGTFVEVPHSNLLRSGSCC